MPEKGRSGFDPRWGQNLIMTAVPPKRMELIKNYLPRVASESGVGISSLARVWKGDYCSAKTQVRLEEMANNNEHNLPAKLETLATAAADVINALEKSAAAARSDWVADQVRDVLEQSRAAHNEVRRVMDRAHDLDRRLARQSKSLKFAAAFAAAASLMLATAQPWLHLII